MYSVTGKKVALKGAADWIGRRRLRRGGKRAGKQEEKMKGCQNI